MVNADRAIIPAERAIGGLKIISALLVRKIIFCSHLLVLGPAYKPAKSVIMEIHPLELASNVITAVQNVDQQERIIALNVLIGMVLYCYLIQQSVVIRHALMVIMTTETVYAIFAVTTVKPAPLILVLMLALPVSHFTTWVSLISIQSR